VAPLDARWVAPLDATGRQHKILHPSRGSGALTFRCVTFRDWVTIAVKPNRVSHFDFRRAARCVMVGKVRQAYNSAWYDSSFTPVFSHLNDF
jgi:hypothetical protein